MIRSPVLREACEAAAVVVIPAWNEAELIGEVVRGVRRAGFMALVIDDGSRDGTAWVALAAGAWIVQHPTNAGKGCALRTGFAIAGRFFPQVPVVTLDGDAQHDPSEIPAFIRRYQEGVEVVLGNRMANPEGMPWIRRLTNRTMSWLVRVRTGIRVHDTQCGFRLLSPRALRSLAIAADGYDVETEILLAASRLGLRTEEVPIRSIYHDRAESGIRVGRDTMRFLKLIMKRRNATRAVRETFDD